MTDGKTTARGPSRRTEERAEESVWTLVLAWSASEPERVGESARLSSNGKHLLGRGEPLAKDPYPRLRFAARRPIAGSASKQGGGPLSGASLSREQLHVAVSDEGLTVENKGRARLWVDGREGTFFRLQGGEVLHVEGELVLLLARQRANLPVPNLAPVFAETAFGEADAFGIVGESPAAWALRDRLSFVAPRSMHVALFGESGTGKELAAQAIHRLSPRASGPLVSRNAATLPEGLIDAELFGNAKSYPNAGMAERAGLVGQAHGGSLFLDEIAELAEESQAHLLRVLDNGEYQRLGEAGSRKSDLRLIAATNRPESALKHDLFARLKLRVAVPSLMDRREDIPLVLRHLLRRARASDGKLLSRFALERGDELRVDLRLVEALLLHRYSLHVRELDALLWAALAGSSESTVELTDEVSARINVAAPEERAVDVSEIGKEQIEAALALHEGNQTRAFRELGLRSRDQLYRLMRKHGVR